MPPVDRDDTPLLLVLCCHPALSEASRVALTLRSVGGLRTEQVAAAFLVPDRDDGAADQPRQGDPAPARCPVRAPAPEELAERLHAVRQVLYLAFNEGYAATAGEQLTDVSVAGEAIRLTRMLARPRPRPVAPTTRRPGCWR